MSPSLPRAIALPDRSPGQAKTTSFIAPPQRQPWRRWEDGYAVTSASAEWDAVIAGLAAEIKIRHYSRKTFETYVRWSGRFQRFLQDKAPESLSAKEVKEYPTCLAVQCRVPASTRNQALIGKTLAFHV